MLKVWSVDAIPRMSFYAFEIDFVTLFWQQKKTLQKQSHTLTFAEELPQLTH